jgi:hypothetical protein
MLPTTLHLSRDPVVQADGSAQCWLDAWLSA